MESEEASSCAYTSPTAVGPSAICMFDPAHVINLVCQGGLHALYGSTDLKCTLAVSLLRVDKNPSSRLTKAAPDVLIVSFFSKGVECAISKGWSDWLKGQSGLCQL